MRPPPSIFRAALVSVVAVAFSLMELNLRAETVAMKDKAPKLDEKVGKPVADKRTLEYRAEQRKGERIGEERREKYMK